MIFYKAIRINSLRLRQGLAGLLLLAAAACSGGDGAVTATPDSGVGDVSDANPDSDAEVLPALLDACAHTKAITGGTLCALIPSELEVGAKDRADGTGPANNGLGLGYHAMAIPDNPDSSKALWIHFGGTYGRPFNQDSEKYATEPWFSELMQAGYTVIQPAYDNRFSINEDTCQAPNPGSDRDNCAAEARNEVLTGEDTSPYRETDVANSFDRRLQVLLAFAKSHSGSALPEDVDPAILAWSDYKLSGHSQGGNMAYYVAKFRGARFACLLGSPYDVGDSVNPGAVPIADWFTESGSMVSVDQLGQLITSEDDSAQAFRAAGRLIGLRADIEAFEVSKESYSDKDGMEVNGHAAVIADPSLKADRENACLRD